MSVEERVGARRVIIMGAAGRDFHNFNLVFREDPETRVVAFTAAQIPNIAGRRYPPGLAGPLYGDGIPIYPEEQLDRLIREQAVDWVYLAYSDLAHEDVMHKAARVVAAGASFGLLGPNATMLRASRPVVSVGAVRTGVGKSALARWLVRWFRARGHRVVAIRHPMPYGDLERQAVQRFAGAVDLDAAQVTVEEREEYEPYLREDAVVFAGVDYQRILERAEAEADVIVWDGGNNDLPFIRPDLHIVLLDARRPGQETAYWPGEANARMADVLVISKVDSADPAAVERLRASAERLRPGAPIALGELVVAVDRPDLVTGKRVVVVGDGPTLTHGGMATGAGTLAARRFGAAEIVDPRPYAVGAIAGAFQAFPHLANEIPALGYSHDQIVDLAATIRATPVDVVLDATPANLARLFDVGKSIVEVSYEFQERGQDLQRSLRELEHRLLPR
ncbi:MAG: cyclic 2,3-diphosphoglycerate synthase [Chloroflexota bacterium]